MEGKKNKLTLAIFISIFVLLFGNNIIGRLMEKNFLKGFISKDEKVNSLTEIINYDDGVINQSQREIDGDFNGDGELERLTYKIRDRKGKIFEEDIIVPLLRYDYDTDSMIDNVGQFYEKINFSGTLICEEGKIPPLKSLSPGGLNIIINEGDLNGDGIDELAISEEVIHYSGIQHVGLFSLINNNWKRIASLSVSCCIQSKMSDLDLSFFGVDSTGKYIEYFDLEEEEIEKIDIKSLWSF